MQELDDTAFANFCKTSWSFRFPGPNPLAWFSSAVMISASFVSQSWSYNEIDLLMMTSWDHYLVRNTTSTAQTDCVDSQSIWVLHRWRVFHSGFLQPRLGIPSVLCVIKGECIFHAAATALQCRDSHWTAKLQTVCRCVQLPAQVHQPKQTITVSNYCKIAHVTIFTFSEYSMHACHNSL